MKFMVLVPANKDTEADVLPTAEELGKMAAFNEELVKAGVLLAGEGLRASSKGARIAFGEGGKTSIIDGPFTASKELVAGFFIIQVKSLDEALAWMRRAPFPEGTTLEVRPLFSDDDFAPVDPTGELREQDAKLRAEVEKQQGRA